MMDDETTGDYYLRSFMFLPYLIQLKLILTILKLLLNNTDEYDSDDAGEIILAGAITDEEIKLFYGEETGC